MNRASLWPMVLSVMAILPLGVVSAQVTSDGIAAKSAPLPVEPIVEPTHGTTLRRFRTYPLIDRANRAVSDGSLEKARLYVERALEIEKRDPLVWIAAGGVDLFLQAHERAESRFSRALALAPRSGTAHLYRGIARLRGGFLREGLLDIARAFETETLGVSEEALARRTIERLGYDRQFLLKQVVEDGNAKLREALRDAKPRDAYRALADRDDLPIDLYLMRAELASELGRHDAVLADADRLREAKPDSSVLRRLYRLESDAHAALGEVGLAVALHRTRLERVGLGADELDVALEHARQADDTESLTVFREAKLAFASETERTALLAHLAETARQTGDYPLAKRRFRELALDMTLSDTDRAAAWRSVGQLEERTDDPVAAWIAFDKAVSLNGLSKDIERRDALASEPAVARYRREQAGLTRRVAAARLAAVRASEREALLALRQRFWEGFEQDKCSTTLAAVLREADPKVFEGELVLGAAECFRRTDREPRAIQLFRRALSPPSSLTSEDRLYSWTSLAHLYQSRRDGDPLDAYAAWSVVDALRPSDLSRMYAASAAWRAGKGDRARELVDRVEPDALPDKRSRLELHDTVVTIHEERDPQRALRAATDALALSDTAARHRQIAELSRRLGDTERALRHLERAISLRPGDVDTLLALGYAAQAHGDTDQALAAFERLAERHPDDAEVALQYGYLLKTAGRDREAASAFRRHIDAQMAAVNRVELQSLRSEILALERRTYVFGEATSERRGAGAAAAGIGDAGESLLLETGLDLLRSTPRRGFGLTTFARLSGLSSSDVASVDDVPLNGAEIVSFGLGLRLQPDQLPGMFLQAERRFGANEETDDETLVAIGYEWSRGFERIASATRWPRLRLYADASHSIGDRDSRAAFAEALAGRAYAFGPRTTVMPHFVSSASRWDVGAGFDHAVDAGVGIGVDVALGGDRYRTASGAFGLTLQYRTTLDRGVDIESNDDEFVVRGTFRY